MRGDFRAHFARVGADAAGEDHGVKPAERRQLAQLRTRGSSSVPTKLSSYQRIELRFSAPHWQLRKMTMVIAQNGPGDTGLVTAVQTAYWNHTPMLLVTPQAANKTIGHGDFAGGARVAVADQAAVGLMRDIPESDAGFREKIGDRHEGRADDPERMFDPVHLQNLREGLFGRHFYCGILQFA